MKKLSFITAMAFASSSYAGSFYISADGGAASLGGPSMSYYPGGGASMLVPISYDIGTSYAASVGYNINEKLSIESSFRQVENDYDFADAEGVSESDILALSGYYNFSLLGKVQPYVSMSLLAMKFDIQSGSESFLDGSSVDSKTSLGYGLEFGARYLISSHYSVFTSAQYMHFGEIAFVEDVSNASVDSNFSHNYNPLLVKFGLRYTF